MRDRPQPGLDHDRREREPDDPPPPWMPLKNVQRHAPCLASPFPAPTLKHTADRAQHRRFSAFPLPKVTESMAAN